MSDLADKAPVDVRPAQERLPFAIGLACQIERAPARRRAQLGSGAAESAHARVKGGAEFRGSAKTRGA
ncbi:MAG: hypothetical protein DPW13_07560 [Planctomycetes bacterium]|nr:hypothetical protein [Planctomycetota bacterium]